MRSPGNEYRMPAEWEPHRGTWLSWPRENGISFPGRYPAVHECYGKLIRTLAAHEGVFVNIADEEMEALARATVGPVEGVEYHLHPSDEPWCRDHGPVFVRDLRNGGLAVTDWDYNAWGGKYHPFDRDNAIPGRIATLRSLRRVAPGMVLEGGSIEVNGQGLLLTTRSCLRARNPGLSEGEIEERLRRYLGAERTLWLEGGLPSGDDTDGHVDNLARFVSIDTVVASVEEDPADENHPLLQENLRELQHHGRKHSLRIVPLPAPQPIVQEGERLPAFYTNFYIANGLVIVPAFRDPGDRKAREILAGLFPGRRVVSIDATDLVWGYGTVHCLTQQEPAP